MASSFLRTRKDRYVKRTPIDKPYESIEPIEPFLPHEDDTSYKSQTQRNQAQKNPTQSPTRATSRDGMPHVFRDNAEGQTDTALRSNGDLDELNRQREKRAEQTSPQAAERREYKR